MAKAKAQMKLAPSFLCLSSYLSRQLAQSSYKFIDIPDTKPGVTQQRSI
jgi:hypothetical protein